jgi:hypothetical protein
LPANAHPSLIAGLARQIQGFLFVFNIHRTYDGSLPGGIGATLREVAYATLILAGIFFILSLLNAFITEYLRRIF